MAGGDAGDRDDAAIADASLDGGTNVEAAADAAAPEDGAAADVVAMPDAPRGDGSSALNGCTIFEDHTADADPRTISWGFSIPTDPARCMKVRVGQSVTWNGSFTEHPLLAQGGDTPNPIASVGASGTVLFPGAGTFGFACSNHAFMTGAIEVIP